MDSQSIILEVFAEQGDLTSVRDKFSCWKSVKGLNSKSIIPHSQASLLSYENLIFP